MPGTTAADVQALHALAPSSDVLVDAGRLAAVLALGVHDPLVDVDGVRADAGAPLVPAGGEVVGAVSVLAVRLRAFVAEDVEGCGRPPPRCASCSPGCPPSGRPRRPAR